MKLGSVSENALQLVQVSFNYGAFQALCGVDLAVCKGEFFGFLGPNGAGKSTLMKILAGLQRPVSGSYALAHPGKRPGYVPQEIALYESLTAAENLAIFGKLLGVRGKILAQRTELLLTQVGLWERRKALVSTFSGGMKRRLNIAAAMLHEPEVLLCDEPTVGIDPQSRNAIFDFLCGLNRQGVTIVYTTHYMEEVERLCSRVAIMDHGKILACDHKDRLLEEYDIGHELLLRKSLPLAAIRDCLPPDCRVEETHHTYRLQLTETIKLAEVFPILRAAGVSDTDIEVRRPNLETLFLRLTGTSLRD